MIDVTGEAAIGPEGEDDLRANLANAENEIADGMRQVDAVELAVGIVENLAATNAKELEAANSARRNSASSSCV
jgi:hypothetical protein